MKPKKQSIYATAKMAREWASVRAFSGPISTIERRKVACIEFRDYAEQNFLRLLRALKREHGFARRVAAHRTTARHDPKACPTCKLIKRMEEMK